MKSFNKKDKFRNKYQLEGSLMRRGYDWWWHSFTGYHETTGEEKTFFIEYYLCNPGIGAAKPMLGQDPEVKQRGGRPSYMMVKCGSWGEDHAQLHRFFSWRSVNVHKDIPFELNAGNCQMNEEFMRGSVNVKEAEEHPEWMCDNGSMEWRLNINKRVAFNVGFGAGWLFRAINAFEMYWHAEGMKTEYDGYVVYNGEKYIVSPETCFGYADKNWGSDFTSPWLWLSSNDLVSRISGNRLTDSVFDIGGGRPKVFGIGLKNRLLGAFWYEGKPYEFNFTKLSSGCKTEFECRELSDQVVWHVRQETKTAVMITDVTCDKKDMILANYESPEGQKKHNRLFNGGTGTGRIQLFEKVNGEEKLIDDIDAKHIGCEWGEYGVEE